MRKFTRNSGVKSGEIYFIAGEDSLRDMKSWRQNEKLLATYNFVFVLRPGVDTGDFRNFLPEKAWRRVCDCTGLGPARIRRLVEEKRPGVNLLYIVDIEAPDISATGIRARIASGKDFRSAVPVAVHNYIKKLGLYGD